jgi:excinuclease UvrABC ATPase subunit
MDPIRRLFARENGVSASLFSFNSEGACPKCRGLGILYTDLAFMDPIKTTCDACDGRRFTDEVLRYTLDGRSVSDVLGMTATEALDFFGAPDLGAPDVTGRLRAMVDVGLDYLTLGQPLSSLSGGECQRIKLASELRKSGNVYVLDEPTTGLHMADVDRLLALLDRLVDAGNSVVVVEHNLDVIAHADWVIDLGPEGGNQGGTVVFEGTPRGSSPRRPRSPVSICADEAGWGPGCRQRAGDQRPSTSDNGHYSKQKGRSDSDNARFC